MAFALVESALTGRVNSDEEWLDYFRSFHEQLPNANDLFTFLKTRTDDTSYSMLAKSVSASANEVLDIGCGDGNLFEDLLKHTEAKIYGVDISRAEIEIARRRYADERRISLEVGDAARLPFEDRRFDCVVAHQFLNFLPHPSTYLDEIARVLRPGGRLVAVCNASLQTERPLIWTQLNEAALEAVRDIYPEFVWPKMGDRRFYRAEAIRDIFSESAGFDVMTFSTGAFVSSAIMTVEQVVAIYNRLYFYALLPEKAVVLEAVRRRARELAKSDLVDLALPFRLISVRTK